jgi:hypothetical protein
MAGDALLLLVHSDSLRRPDRLLSGSRIATEQN